MLSGGRGPRNPFGDDFAANGNVSDFFGAKPFKVNLDQIKFTWTSGFFLNHMHLADLGN